MRLIDADELGRRMYDEAFEKDSEDQRWDSGCWIRYRLFEKILKEQPTVEPERKTGKWILKRKLVPLARDSMPFDHENYDEATHSEWEEYYCCSECNYESGEFTGGKFCTNCGAKMEVEG